MKTSIFSVCWCAIWISLSPCGCHAQAWSSPDGSVTLKFESANSSTGSLDRLVVNETQIEFISSSPIRRENHGFDWLTSVSPTWINNRFVAFEDDMGLCLVDTQQRKVLLDQVFTAYTKSPVSDTWVAIRYRPTGRNQEMLTGNEMDTVWFIEPTALAEKAQMVTDANPFAHVPAVRIDGIAVASPQWSEYGASVAIVKHRDGKLAADVFDPVSKVLVRTVPMQDVTLTQEQLRSVWIIPEIDRRASEAIKEKHVFETGNIQVTSTPSLKQPEARMSGDPTNSTPSPSPKTGKGVRKIY